MKINFVKLARNSLGDVMLHSTNSLGLIISAHCSLTLSLPSLSIGTFTHLKLCLADAKYILKQLFIFDKETGFQFLSKIIMIKHLGVRSVMRLEVDFHL